MAEDWKYGCSEQGKIARSWAPQDDREGVFGRTGVAAMCKAVALGSARSFSGL